MVKRTPARFDTYGQILHALEDAAMQLVRHVAGDREVLNNDGVRTFAILSAIVRRSIVVSQHLQAIGVIDQIPRPPKRSILATLEVALGVYADHKIDAATHRAWMDDDIDADDDFTDIAGRHPAALVVELCRDLGMVATNLSTEWLDELSPDIRLLAARAAAASIGPTRSKPRLGRVPARETRRA